MSARRIVVALGTADSAAAIGTAIELARGMTADLLGLFIEDSQLLRLAALSLADEVGYPSRIRRSLDPEAMARALRAQAQRVRHELGARLAGQPVKWTFEVVRGHPASALTAIAAQQDIVVMPAPRPVAGGFRTRAAAGLEIEPLPGPLLVVTTSLRSAQSIAVVPPPDVLPQDIVPIFSTLAGLYGRSALFTYPEAEAAHWASWRQDMQALLAAHALLGHFRIVDDTGPTGLNRVCAGQLARIVVPLGRTPASRAALLAALALPPD